MHRVEAHSACVFARIRSAIAAIGRRTPVPEWTHVSATTATFGDNAAPNADRISSSVGFAGS